VLAKKEMPEYAGTSGVFRTFMKAVDSEKPPLHMPLGTRACALARTKIAEFTQDIDSWEGRRRRPTTSKSADRLESLRARKRVAV
jgi:hypothetical protein